MHKRFFFVLSFTVLFVFMAVTTGLTQVKGDVDITKLSEEEMSVLYPKTTQDYRGVISANMAGGDLAHELLVDFGSKGVWWLGGISSSWVKVSSDNPTNMLGMDIDGDGVTEVVLDFGSLLGIWLFDYTGGVNWTQLTDDSPTDMIAVNDDTDVAEELHCDFGANGLWRYDSSGGWKKLTSDNPSKGFRADFWDKGLEEAIWYFSSGVWAVWQQIGPTTKWDQLSPDYIDNDNISAELGIGDDSEEVIFDFYSKGTWGMTKEGYGETFHKLTNDDPYDIVAVKFVGNADYEFLVRFNNVGGLWMWNTSDGTFGGTTWTKLTNDNPTADEAFCEPFDPNGLYEPSGDEEVAVDFGGMGLWLYNWTSSAKWTKLTNDSPDFMIRSDLNGHGVDDILICDFGTKGLWYYNGNTSTWTRLTGDSPDNE